MASRTRLNEHYSITVSNHARPLLEHVLGARISHATRDVLHVRKYLPGVIGGVVDLHSIPAERSSEKTSPSQPCLTPSIPSPGKNPLRGVGIMSHTEGGLLMLLPVEDRGG